MMMMMMMMMMSQLAMFDCYQGTVTIFQSGLAKRPRRWYSFGRATHGELGRPSHTGPEAVRSWIPSLFWRAFCRVYLGVTWENMGLVVPSR